MKIIKIFTFILITVCTMPDIAKDSATDMFFNVVVCCNDNCKEGTGDPKNIPNGGKVYCDFPKTKQCKVTWTNDSWSGCEQNVCPNFDLSVYNQNPDRYQKIGSTTKPGDSAACWQWKCAGGYIWYGSQCIKPEECRAMTGFDVSSDGTQCISSKWCNDTYKNAYAANPALYTQGCSVEMTDKRIGVGIFGLGINIKVCTGCLNLKCANGCMDSATSTTCKPVDPDGKIGGASMDPTTFICKTCDATSYVDSKSATGCTPATKATRTQMCNCFGCVGKPTKDSAGKDIDAFANCVKTGKTDGCDQASAANVVCQ